MRIGFDLDGIVTVVRFRNLSFRLPWFLFIFLLPLVLFVKPRKAGVDKIRKMKDEGHEIIIVSARPPWAEIMTRWWLKRYRISFDKIFCVGFGTGTKQRKLEVIKRVEIDLFYEDDCSIAEFLKENSVKVYTL